MPRLSLKHKSSYFLKKGNPVKEPPLASASFALGKAGMEFCPSLRPVPSRSPVVWPLLWMSLPFCNAFSMILIYLSPILRVVLLCSPG